MKTCKATVNAGYKFDYKCYHSDDLVENLYLMFEKASNANDSKFLEYHDRLRNHSICFGISNRCGSKMDKLEYGVCKGPTREELLREQLELFNTKKILENKIQDFNARYSHLI